MEGWSLEFESWDLAGVIRPLVGLLLAVEWLLWVRRGVGGRRLRRLFGGIAVLVCTGAAWAWLVRGRTPAPGAQTASHGWDLAALAILAIVWTIRGYRATTRPVEARDKVLLIGLRAVAITGVLLVLARPVLRLTRLVEDRGTVALLIDDSRSMTIRDVSTPGGSLRSRIEQLGSLLAQNRATLDAIRRTRDLQIYGFDTALRPAKPEQITGAGQATALATAVQEAAQRASAGGKRLVGVLLISDGRDNSSSVDPLGVAAALARTGTALWAVGVGSELPAGQTRGLVARRLTAPHRIGLQNRLPVQIELVALGLAGQDIQVELLFDEEVVAATTVRPSVAKEMLPVELEHIPAVPGLHKITMRATAGDLPPDRRTVSLTQFVQVTREFVEVLFVDRPRYERAAIARSLEAAREIHVTKLDAGRRGGIGARRLPGTPEAWQAFDVVLIGDVTPDAIGARALEAIRTLVIDHGRGLLLAAGEEGLRGGSFTDSALADVLPMRAASPPQSNLPLRLEPTSPALMHPVCRLAETADATRESWASLPPTTPAAVLSDVKPAAVALLAGSAGQPMLIVQEVGRGRSAALAIDATWRWSMEADKGREIQSRFWRQMVLWLANRRPSLWVTTNQARYQLARLSSRAETVVVEAGIEHFGTGPGPAGTIITGEITGPGGFREVLSFVPRGDHQEARPTPTRPGDYQIEVRIAADNAPAEPARAAFVIESPDIELAEGTADFELLRQMAARTRAAGGAFATADNAAAIFEQVLAGDPTVRRPVSETAHLVERNRWPILLVVVLALAAEWLIRRHRGLP